MMQLLLILVFAGSVFILLVQGLLSNQNRLRNLLTVLKGKGSERDANYIVKSQKQQQTKQMERGQRWLAQTLCRYQQMGIRVNRVSFLFLSFVCAGVLAALVLTLTKNTIAAMITIPLGLFLPKMLLDKLANRRKQQLEVECEGVIDQLANLYRVYGSFYKALLEVIGKMNGPLRQSFQQVIADYNTGLSMQEALANLNERLPSSDVRLFTKAVSLHEVHGGETERIVEQIAETIRERRTLREERKAETAGQSLMIGILLAAPPLLLVLIFAWLPDFRQVLTSTLWGQIGVAIMAANEVLVVFLVHWLTRTTDV